MVKVDEPSPFPTDQPQQGFLDGILDGFLTLLGLRSKCKLLTLFKIPEDDPDVFELRVECIESRKFYLNKKSNSAMKNGWMQIKHCDESADFTIRSGGKVILSFNGNVRPSEFLPQTPQITFQKCSTCFVDVQLELRNSILPKGFMMCYANNTLVDWKRLNLKYLSRRYKGNMNMY